jgi:ferritin-like protein
MGLLDRHGARAAHEQVYGGGVEHQDVTHELLAGAAGFEAVRLYKHHRDREGIVGHHEHGEEMLAGLAAEEVDKHFHSGRYGHLDLDQARAEAQEQAGFLWNAQYGRY